MVPTPLLAQGVPTILSYQGRLADASGNLLGGSGTAYYFKFSIWDDPSAGAGGQLWPRGVQPQAVSATVRQGVFTVNIGDTLNGYPDTLDFDFNSENPIYLQVEVSSDNNTFQTLSPRQLISSAAFAQLSGRVSGTGQSAFGTTTPLSNVQVTAEATTTTAIPLALRGASGQTANLFQIQNASASNLLYVNASGGLFASSTLQITATTTLYSDLAVSGRTQFNSNFYTWPSSISAGDFLQTDASGNLTWASPSSSGGGWTDGGTVVSPTTATDLISFANGSSTQFSIVDRLYIGGTSTTTLFGNGATSTFAGNVGASGDLAADQLFLTGATSTAANGFNLTGGCFAINDVCISAGGGGAVDSVSNSDSTLTISPTTGAVVASLNLGNANTWTALQTFSSGLLSTASSTITGLTTVNSTSTNATTTNLAITNLAAAAGAFLAVNPNGQVIATTTISGTNTGDVTLAGTSDYLTISGQVITRNTIDISDDTNLAATYPIQLTGDTLSLAFGTTTSNTWAGTQTLTNLIVTDATTTSFTLGTDYLTDITGAGLIISANALTVDDVTPTMLQAADFGSFTCNGTTCTVDNDAIALATQTTGNYVATLSSSGSITVGNSGSENAAVTVDLNLGNANTWTALQTFSSGLLSTASSTITGLTMVNSTSTNATTTNLAITNLAAAAGAFLAVNPNGQVIATTTPGGAVTSVSNSDSTLTISPTTGAVVASLNLGNANTWTGLQQFANATTTQLTVSSLLYLGGDAIDELVGTGLTLSGGDLQTTLGTSISANEIADGDHGDFTYTTGVAAIDADAVALATDTTGNFVATVGSSGSITVGNSGSENAAVTVNLNMGNANTWTALQSFANASTSVFSNTGTAYFGGTATSTFNSAGALTLASALAVTSGGTGATSLNDLITLGTHTSGNYLATLTNAGGLTVANSGTENAGVTIAIDTTNPNTWTGLQQFAQASSTMLSVYGPAYFGSTATSTFDTAGALTLASALGIGSGGTNNTSFTTGALLYYDGSAIASTSTNPLYIGAFAATSTTATSTIATGGLAIATNKLVVQQSSGNIGIGTASPTTGLDVDVTTDISGNLTISGGSNLTISSTGAINQSGSGQVTFAGNVDATNGLDVTGANFVVGSNKLTVAPATGNTAVGGTLAVTGAAAASSTLQVTGATRLFSTLQTDGALTAAAAGTGLSVTNNASVGGTLAVTGAATLSDNLAVTGTLSAGATTLSGNLAMSSNKITGLANPASDNDAANKSYVDSVAQGLTLKDSVRVGTTADITLSGEQTIDGVSVVAGDRVLVKNQNTASQNGLYVASAGAWSRSTDADEDSEVAAGMFTFITEGSTSANSGWVLTTTGAITLGSTSLSFTQFSGAGQIVAGTGMTKSGNTLDVAGTANRITANADSIDIAATYVGQGSITTVGSLSSGSISSGFGTINIGSNALTAGAISGTNITGSGNLEITGTSALTGNVTMSGELAVATTTLSGNLVMSGKKITGLADPTAAQEAATKAYVDSVAQGLTVKDAVVAASTANLTLSGEQTVDGVSLVTGNRILVKDQSTASQNGIYVVDSGAWSRSSDADENSEVSSGMYAFVSSGTTQANTGWILTTTGSITLDSTSLTFTQFSGSNEVTAGNGLTKTGNTIDVVGTANRITVSADAIDIAATYVGQGSIVTVGALTSGSIASGFGNIDIGASTLAAGVSTFATTTSYGDVAIGRTATTTIKGDSATSTFSGGISLAAGNINLATGGAFLINNAGVLSATALGSGVVGSSLTSVGTLASGAISAGFGAIDIGADSLTAGATTITTLSASGLGTFSAGLLSTSSSTIASLTTTNATSTNATTTNFAISGLATSAGTILAVDPTGQVIATTTPQGAVTSVSNSDSTLTISPTTGAVVASLNLGNANTWTALQTFSSGLLSTASSTITNLTMVNSTSTNATTTNLAITNLAAAAGAFLAVNPNGQVIATTTISGTNTGDVTLAGTPDYLTISGQVITRNTIDISDDTNLAATYPIQLTGDTLSLAFGTTTSNTWAGTQTLTNLIVTDATTTSFTLGTDYLTEIEGDGLIITGNALTVDDVTPTMLQSADFGDFTCNGTTCSLDNDTVAEAELDLTAVTLADFTNDAGFVTTSGANTWSALQQFTAASTTRLSVYGPAYFGATATSTFDTAGNLNLASGAAYSINGASVLSATALGSGVTASSLTSLGTLSSLIVSGLSTLSGGLLVNNSTSTITNLTTVNATSTNATTTTFAITNLATAAGAILAVNPNGQVIATTTISGTNTGDVTLAGTPDYLTISGQVITRGTIDISDDTNLAVTYPLQKTDDTLSLAFGTTTSNTWSNLQTFSSGLLSTASSTITGLTMVNSTSTNATSTNFAVTTLCLTEDTCRTTWPTGGTSQWTDSGSDIYFSSGNVGIGSTTPWGNLSVELGTDNPSLVVANQGSSTPAFYIGGVNQNGNVGIGTSNPQSALGVNGNITLTDNLGAARTIGLDQSGVNGASLSILAGPGDDAGGGNLVLSAGSSVGNAGGSVTINSGTTGGFGNDADINLNAQTTGSVVVTGQALNLGAAGVRLTADGDGALTFLGLGNGSDESLILNLDDTANQAVWTTSTGVTLWDLQSMGLNALKLSVGSTTPWGDFSVEMDTDSPALVVANQGSSTPAFYIGGVNQNGNVGFGTTSPYAQVAIQSGNQNITSLLVSYDSVYNYPAFEIYDNNAGARLPILQLFGDQLLMQDLVSTGPEYSFINDPNTGLAGDGSDSLHLDTGGTARLTIDTSKITLGLPILSSQSTSTIANLTMSTATTTALYVIGTATTTFSGGIKVSGSLQFNETTTGRSVEVADSTVYDAAGGSLYISAGDAGPTDLLGGAGGNVTIEGGLASDGSGNGKVLINGTNHGYVGIGTSTPQHNLDVGGTWGGQVITNTGAYTSNQTVAISGSGLIYHLTNNSGTTDAAVTVTYNITGLSSVEGSFAYIYTFAQKGATTGSRTSTVTIQVNGSQVGTKATSNTTAAQQVFEAYVLAYSNGSWHVFGAPSTTDLADIAEWTPYTGERPEAGEIVALSDDPVRVERSSAPYSPKLAGVVSTDPHTVIGPETPDSIPLVLAGRVPVRVNDENGPIEIGDWITSSSQAGVGMKAVESGLVVGQAMESYSGSGVGSIMMLASKTHYLGEASEFTVADPSGDIVDFLQVERLAVGEIVALDGQEITFNNEVVFLGRPHFNSDTGGFAEIKEGDREVEVVFDEEYAEEPVVNATLSAKASDEEEIFDVNLRYLITEKGTTGFKIKLNRAAPRDLIFNWVALAIDNPRIFTSSVIDGLQIDTGGTGGDSGAGGNESGSSSSNSDSNNENIVPPDTDSTGSDGQTSDSADTSGDSGSDAPADDSVTTDESTDGSDEPPAEGDELEPPAENSDNSGSESDDGSSAEEDPGSSGSEEPAPPDDPAPAETP